MIFESGMYLMIAKRMQSSAVKMTRAANGLIAKAMASDICSGVMQKV